MPAALYLDLGLFGSNPATSFVPNNQDVWHVARFGLDPSFIVYKRSAESLPIDFDLSGVLPAGTVVSSVVSLTCDQAAGPMLTNPVVSTTSTSYIDSGTTVLAGLVVQFTASAGTPQLPMVGALAPYLVRLIYNTSDGATREAIGYLAVVDLPNVGVELS